MKAQQQKEGNSYSQIHTQRSNSKIRQNSITFQRDLSDSKHKREEFNATNEDINLSQIIDSRIQSKQNRMVTSRSKNNQASPISNFSISQVSESLLLSPMSYQNVMNNSSIILMSGKNNKQQQNNQSTLSNTQAANDSKLTAGQRNLRKILGSSQVQNHSKTYSQQSNKMSEVRKSSDGGVSQFREESGNKLSHIQRSQVKENILHNISFSNDQNIQERNIEISERMSNLLSDTILKNPKSLSENNTKLSLVEKQIDILDDLQSQKLNTLETVFLSSNNLTEIETIIQFPNIRNLSISYNKIKSLNDLRVLGSLKKLESLRIEGNPIVNNFPNIRDALLCLIPNLKVIDGNQVTSKDIQDAQISWTKMRSLLEMCKNFDTTKDILGLISKKVDLHFSLYQNTYLYDFESSPRVDYLVQIQKKIEFGDAELVSWFERNYLFHKENGIGKKLNAGQWDKRFSLLIIDYQNQIALKRQELKQQFQKIKSHKERVSKQLSSQKLSSLYTPRVMQASKITIQSPKIIQTEYSPLRTLQDFSYNQNSMPKSSQIQSRINQNQVQQNELQMSDVKLKYGNENLNNFNQLQSVSFNLSTDKKSNFINGSASQHKPRKSNSQTPISNIGGGSTVTKKKKKQDKSLGDIQQMNLTKLLEGRDNQSNFNNDLSNLLMDQTFSGLLLNDTHAFDPLASNENQSKSSTHPLPLSSQVIPSMHQPPAQEIEMTLQYLEKLETLESQLRQREQQNEELSEKNKLLIQKIKEFQEQNKVNVEQARDQIIQLQRQLKITADEKEVNSEAQESLKQSLEYIEEENKILQMRLAEIESFQAQTQELSQRIQSEKQEMMQNFKAKQFNESWIKLRWFRRLRKSCRLFFIVEQHLMHKRLKREHFLRLISFLYLRQNYALQKHIKQLGVQKKINLKYAIIYTLNRNKRICQNMRIRQLQKDYKLLQSIFKRLVIHRQISEQRRRQKQNALSVRQILLKSKSLRGLKQNARLNQMPINSDRDEAMLQMVGRFRKFIIMRAFQKVVFRVIPLRNINILKALQKYKKTLISQCFNQVFKRIIWIKKTYKPKVKMFRMKHDEQLMVKGFSILLFNKIEQQKKQPMIQMQQFFTKKRLFQLWYKNYKRTVTLESKLKFFNLRWKILRKKIYLRALQFECLRQHKTDKCYSAVKDYYRQKCLYKFMFKWRAKLREELLEHRRIKYQIIKILKRNFADARRKMSIVTRFRERKIDKRILRKTFNLLTRVIKQKLKNKSKVQVLRIKHIEKLKSKVMVAFIKNVKIENNVRCKQEIRRVQDELIPLQATYGSQQEQANYFIQKCKELQIHIDRVEEKFEESERKQDQELRNFYKEKQGLNLQIQEYLSQIDSQQSQIQELESQNQNLQELMLRKLEEYKCKFTASESEMIDLQQRVCDQQEKIELLTSENQQYQLTVQLLSSSNQMQGQEKENNIKMLHQLKKAHKTIEEMRKVLIEADQQVSNAKSEVDTIRRDNKEEVDQLKSKQIKEITEITGLAEKVRSENIDLKKEVKYLTQKLEKILVQQYERRRIEEQRIHHMNELNLVKYTESNDFEVIQQSESQGNPGIFSQEYTQVLDTNSDIDEARRMGIQKSAKQKYEMQLPERDRPRNNNHKQTHSELNIPRQMSQSNQSQKTTSHSSRQNNKAQTNSLLFEEKFKDREIEAQMKIPKQKRSSRGGSIRKSHQEFNESNASLSSNAKKVVRFDMKCNQYQK